MNFYRKAMMAEGGAMPQPAEEQQMSEGMKQLQMLKAAHDKAIEEKNMEMIGKIETVIKDMYDQMDERGRELISDLFPDLDFMVDVEEEREEMMEEEREEGPTIQQMMAAGGSLKMVKNDEGETVPFYAADGIGKMMAGGYLGKKKKMTYPGGGYVMMK
jgi:hypothetical protein